MTDIVSRVTAEDIERSLEQDIDEVVTGLASFLSAVTQFYRTKAEASVRAAANGGPATPSATVEPTPIDISNSKGRNDFFERIANEHFYSYK